MCHGLRPPSRSNWDDYELAAPGNPTQIAAVKIAVLMACLACVNSRAGDQTQRAQNHSTQTLPGLEMHDGAIVRGPREKKAIALVFTGHEFAEGASVILNQLSKRKARASFFFTGDFLRHTNHADVIRRIVRTGHFVGPHSDKHLPFCSWDTPSKLLVTRDQFRSDLEANISELAVHGIPARDITFFLPPYEHYDRQIAAWTQELGLRLINFTPGTRSNADYTEESEKNFVSSEKILQSIFAREEQDGLNGFLLLLHLGSGPGRKDKFHARFGEMLKVLEARGYRFVRVDELLCAPPK